MADPLRVVLVSPRNPLNIGAAARAMSNFGFAEMRLVNAYEIAYREAKSAVRSTYILDRSQTYASVADAVADCSLVVGTTSVGHRDLHVPLYRLETGGKLIRQQLSHGSVALLFGSEKFGLSNEEMSHCNWLMRIPTRVEHGSMNLGQSVAVCLYELRREQSGADQAPYTPPETAPAESLERLTSVLTEVLAESGYSQERTSESSELKLRRLIRRLNVSAHDAEILLGMMRQVLWKIRTFRPV